MEKRTRGGWRNAHYSGRTHRQTHRGSYRGGAHLKMGKEKAGMNEFGGKKWALTALFA